MFFVTAIRDYSRQVGKNSRQMKKAPEDAFFQLTERRSVN
jgi:hypothetical protein